MNRIITYEDKCVACNKCIEACPVNYANEVYLTADGERKVRVDDTYCIHCGACIEACDHEARDFTDDTDEFFSDLRRGENISIVAAPAALTNFDDPKRLFGYLKSVGVNKIYDVSFGADITTWAYLRAIEKYNIKSVVAQPCPAIINYCEHYIPDILSSMSPMQSPLMCMAVYLRKYEGVKDKLAFLSPCVAKVDEIHDPNNKNLVQYNVTFRKLLEKIKNENIRLASYPPTEFDGTPSGIGHTYSRPGGLKENIRVTDPNIRIRQIESPKLAYPYLREYLERRKLGKPLPQVVDILNCGEGCNKGPGTNQHMALDDIDALTDNRKEKKLNENVKNTSKGVEYAPYVYFDKNLKLEDFKREYKNKKLPDVGKNENLDDIYEKLGKTTPVSQKINCFACGYGSCKRFARAIKRGKNLPESCVDYERKLLAQASATAQEGRDRLSGQVGAIVDAVRGVSTTSSDNAKRVQEISSQIAGLANYSKQLKEGADKVVERINDFAKASNDIMKIAGQTNLLALNAAIEAARAGEQGRGFAVVADEVRKLASATNETVKSTEASQSGAVEEVEKMERAAEDIAEKVAAVSDSVRIIAESTQNAANECQEVSRMAESIIED